MAGQALHIVVLLLLLFSNVTAYDLVNEFAGENFFDGWDFYGSWDNLTLGEIDSHRGAYH